VQYSPVIAFAIIQVTDGLEQMTREPMHALALDFISASEAEDWKGAPRGETDFCSREGAAALKSQIEAYWRERGQEVMIVLHNVGFHPAIRAARFDVRSDMVNGRPRAAGEARPANDVFVEDFAADEGDLTFE
jgi:hypothetical protein